MAAVGDHNPDLVKAQKLLAWLQGSWAEPLVGLPEMYQRGPNSIRTKETAQRLAAILEDHGWLQKMESGGMVAGNRRRETWRLMDADGRPAR